MSLSHSIQSLEKEEDTSLAALIIQAENTCKLYEEKEDGSSFDSLKSESINEPVNQQKIVEELNKLQSQVASTKIKKRILAVLVCVVQSQNSDNESDSEKKSDELLDQLSKLGEEVRKLSHKKSSSMLTGWFGSSSTNIYLSEDFNKAFEKLVRMAKEEIIKHMHKAQPLNTRILYSVSEYNELKALLEKKNSELVSELEKSKSHSQTVVTQLTEEMNQIKKINKELQQKTNEMKDHGVKLLSFTPEEYCDLESKDSVKKIIDYYISDFEFDAMYEKLCLIFLRPKFPSTFINNNLSAKIEAEYNKAANFYQSKLSQKWVEEKSSSLDTDCKETKKISEMDPIKELREQMLTHCGSTINEKMGLITHGARLFKQKLYSKIDSPLSSSTSKHPFRFKFNFKVDEEDERLVNKFFDEMMKRMSPSSAEIENIETLARKSENFRKQNAESIKICAQIKFKEKQDQEHLQSLQSHCHTNQFVWKAGSRIK